MLRLLAYLISTHTKNLDLVNLEMFLLCSIMKNSEITFCVKQECTEKAVVFSVTTNLADPVITIFRTRPKPAYGRQGLDWIVGPGYSFVVFSTVGQSDHFS